MARNHGPFPYHQNIFSCPIDLYVKAINRLKSDMNQSNDIFVKRFKQHYDNPLPPIWIMVELMSMGEISKWYGEYISISEKKEMARYYDLPHTVLASWMHSLSTVRNRCAHHNRLYGIYISGGFRIPNKCRYDKYNQIFDSENRNSFYNVIVASCYLLDSIQRKQAKLQFLLDLKEIINEFELKESKFGFPKNKTISELTEAIGN